MAILVGVLVFWALAAMAASASDRKPYEINLDFPEFKPKPKPKYKKTEPENKELFCKNIKNEDKCQK